MENLSSINDTLGKSNNHSYSSSELNSSFKQAAQAISLLYTESGKAAKRAYNTGYYYALQDVLEFLQQSLDSEPQISGGGGKGKKAKGGTRDEERMAMSVQAVMSYIEARQQACRLLAEDDPNSDLPPLTNRSSSPSKHSSSPSYHHHHHSTPKQSQPHAVLDPTLTPSSPISSPNPPSAISTPTPTLPHHIRRPATSNNKRHPLSSYPHPLSRPSTSSSVNAPPSSTTTALGLKRRRSPSNFGGMPIKIVGSDIDVAEILRGDVGGMEGDENKVMDISLDGDEDERPSKRVARR